jgi:YD repeat-containing protein
MRRRTRARNDWFDVRLEHDSLSHTYAEHVEYAGRAGSFTLLRDIDDFGFVTLLTYPSGRAVSYHPDGLNRIVRVEAVRQPQAPEPVAGTGRRLLWENTYRGLRLGKRSAGNGTECSYAYDGAGRVSGIAHRGRRDMNLLTLALLRDASGNLRRKYEYGVPGGDLGEVYGYDSRSQLTLVTKTRPPAGGVDLSLFAPRRACPVLQFGFVIWADREQITDLVVSHVATCQSRYAQGPDQGIRLADNKPGL